MNEKRLILWIMAFGALATFPWMARLGFDIGEFWNLVATAAIGALLSGFLGLVGYFVKSRTGMQTFGVIAVVIIFVLSFLMMMMPV